jgi:hypothetical protein
LIRQKDVNLPTAAPPYRQIRRHERYV